MNRARIEMRLSRAGVEGVALLGRYNYTRARPGLPEHSHRNAIEICFLVRGCQTYRVGRHWFRLRGGDVFIAFPNERHSTGGLPEEKGVLYWMVLDVPRKGGRFLGLSTAQSRAVLHALLHPPFRHFRGGWVMKEHLDAITTLHLEGHGALNGFAMANHARAFLQEVIEKSHAASSKTPARPLAPALSYIERHLDEPCPVPLLAEQTGLSVARFKARFKEETGIPPAEYVLRAKIAGATRRLAAGGESITDIAHALGFSSSQYFATVFKRFTGTTPRTKRVKKENQSGDNLSKNREPGCGSR